MKAEIPSPRVICPPFPLEVGGEFVLKGDPLGALLMREPRLGEAVTVVDPRGREFRARVLRLSSEEAQLVAFEELKRPTEPPFDLYLLQALPDKERMELVIQKATELGARIIVPFKASKSISLEEREARQPKAHRWPHVALKATKQCRRAYLPYVAPYCPFKEALRWAEGAEVKILLYEGGSPLKEVLHRRPPSKAVVMVGPEGGWTEGELKETLSAGFSPCSLGGRVLRTETAAIVACALLMYEWGGLP